MLGANGAGKTTILRAVGGLLAFHRGRIVSGEVTFAGATLKGKSGDIAVARGLGQSLEGRRVFADLTVEENLRLGAFTPRARPSAREAVQAACEMFPRLGERLEQQAGTLSGGEQQMLAIARGLASKPRLLLLDEPSLGLAPLLVAEIGSAIRDIVRSGTAVLLVDQNTALALKATDHAYLLENGRTVAAGETASLLADAQVRASYLGTSSDLGDFPAGGHDESDAAGAAE